MFVDRTALLWDLDPNKMTPDQLDVIANHLLRQALPDLPELVPEVRRRMEAGEMVKVEEVDAVFEEMTEAAGEPFGEQKP